MQTLTVTPIGYIRSGFDNRYDAPRQPEGTHTATIELLSGHNYEQALEDLEGFDYIWVVFWFDRNATWRPKVLPPRGRIKRGVFATRSPHRPNPIGISLLKLVDVSGRMIRVEGSDLLDNTPVLDIKPYLPYAEAHPEARAGWLDEVVSAEEHYPVEYEPLAQEQSEWLQAEHGIKLTGHINRMLSHDPLPHRYRRIEQSGEGFILAIRSWRVCYRIESERVIIERIESGYRPEALEAPEGEIHDHRAHIGFHQQW